MNIGFALVTGNPFFERIVKLENEVHETCGFHNKLQLVENIPHTTLFQGSFEDDTDYSTIVRDIRDFFMSNSEDLKLHFKRVVYVPHGWYFYTCQNTDELQRLHIYTLGLCKEHIILQPGRMDRKMNGLTDAQIEGIERYGYRYSAKAFLPHITIGRNDDDCREDVLETLNGRLSELDSDVPIERITVYRMGEDGMHSETLDEVVL